MAEYIEREVVLKEKVPHYSANGVEIIEGEAIPVEYIKKLPAADVRPVVKAKWYWDAYRYDWCCGNCFHPADHYVDEDDLYNKPSFKFCPHCGADMEG